jgi:hypothetical protein
MSVWWAKNVDVGWGVALEAPSERCWLREVRVAEGDEDLYMFLHTAAG